MASSHPRDTARRIVLVGRLDADPRKIDRSTLTAEEAAWLDYVLRRGPGANPASR